MRVLLRRASRNDDDADCRKMVAAVLEMEGYDVVSFQNGDEALEYLRHAPRHPSCILLDLVMPVADGWMFLRERNSNPELETIPVIVLGYTIRSRAIGKSILRCRDSGNREEKSTPAPRCALDPDASAVSLDDAFGDGEPEPSALTPSPGCLPKSVKDTGQVLGRNATARIRNPEDDLVISRCRSHRDPTASFREFDRVADEVLEHLKEPVSISPDFGNIGVHFASKIKRRRRHERSLHVHRLDNQPTW